jgi:ABC-type bacteriocin/lantibiotic exporter with double-glycine peptidase domain
MQQMTVGYCLPACGQMALDQLDITVTQDELGQVLETQAGYGTPFSRIKRLRRWQIQVEVSEWGGIQVLTEALANDRAVIAAILTNAALPGWSDIQTQHTVLIVGVTPDQVSYHDPAWSEGPVSAVRDEFLLAWGEMDELAATCGGPKLAQHPPTGPHNRVQHT